MDRFAIFVDAGYLYAAAGIVCHGVGDRSRLRLAPTLPAALVELCAGKTGLPYLRTYWYDAAENSIPTAAQQELAALPGIKLRLGRLTAYGQKGVDSLAVRDMIRLAADHAIADAYLVSGDEDLRTGVAEAQDHGVRVSLVAVEDVDERTRVSIALRREADEHLTLDREFLMPHVELLPEPDRDDADLPTVQVGVKDAFQYGRDFAFTWLANAAEQDVEAMAGNRPQIPAEIDRELLRGLMERQQVDSGTNFDFETRKALRGGFWSAIEQVSR